MHKVLQARLQQYMNCELQDVQTGFRKERETRDQIANIHWIVEKARVSRKTPTSALFDYAKSFNCVDHNKLIYTHKFKRWEYQTTLPASWETCM